MVIKAMVAARSGSVRVKDKNIRPFAGKTLLEYKLEQLKRISFFDGVVVNSNDETILEIAKSLGCEAVKREELYASNDVSMNDVYENMAQNIDCDVVVYTNCTNPLVKDETYYEMFEAYKKMGDEFMSLNSAHFIKEFMWLNGKPLNYDADNQPRSQDLPDICALNFAVNFIKREDMIKSKSIIAKNPKLFTMSVVESTDIDDFIDFEFAEYVFNKQNEKR